MKLELGDMELSLLALALGMATRGARNNDMPLLARELIRLTNKIFADYPGYVPYDEETPDEAR